MELLTGTVLVNKLLLAGTVPVNKLLLARTVPRLNFVDCSLFSPPQWYISDQIERGGVRGWWVLWTTANREICTRGRRACVQGGVGKN